MTSAANRPWGRSNKQSRLRIKHISRLFIALIPLSTFCLWKGVFKVDDNSDLTNTIYSLPTDGSSSNNDDFKAAFKALKKMKSEKQAKRRKKKKKKKNKQKNGTVNDETSSESEYSSMSYQLDDSGIQNFISSSKYAYAFLIAGCDPSDPAYLGYIYNVVVAKELLQTFGSMQDVIVMIRMHADTKHTKLPPEQEQIMNKLGLTVVYIPKVKTDNFHTAMMDKFRVLQLTNYERVLYLDADVIPLNNLDYMFHYSTGANPRLEENTVIMYYNEPANGGFFILAPHQNDYAEIVKIIDKVEDQGYDFDTTKGWGHEFIPPDHWESMRSESKGINGTKWDFYGAFTDQGLLYHWTKYVKQKVSIIARDKVQTWRNGQIVKVMPSENVFQYASPNEYAIKPLHGNRDKDILKLVPYRDFHHCREKYKPWLPENAKNPPEDVEDISQIKGGPIQLWFHILRKINKEYGFGIDTEHLTMKRPSLGLYPKNVMVQQVKEAKAKGI